MVNYQNGKIYAIRCLTTKTLYIGSTTKDLLCKRLAEHTSAYKRYIQNNCKYYTVFEVLKHANYIIELIEAFPCSSRNDLENRESYHIKNMTCINFKGSQHGEKYRGDFMDRYTETIAIEYALLDLTTKEKQKFKAYYKLSSELRNIDLCI
jgi:hypothetical protein